MSDNCIVARADASFGRKQKEELGLGSLRVCKGWFLLGPRQSIIGGTKVSKQEAKPR